MLKFRTSIFSALLVPGIVLGGSSNISQAETFTNISVVGREDPCLCGNREGGFEATYNNRKISITFYHSPTLVVKKISQ